MIKGCYNKLKVFIFSASWKKIIFAFVLCLFLWEISQVMKLKWGAISVERWDSKKGLVKSQLSLNAGLPVTTANVSPYTLAAITISEDS